MAPLRSPLGQPAETGMLAIASNARARGGPPMSRGGPPPPPGPMPKGGGAKKKATVTTEEPEKPKPKPDIPKPAGPQLDMNEIMAKGRGGLKKTGANIGRVTVETPNDEVASKPFIKEAHGAPASGGNYHPAPTVGGASSFHHTPAPTVGGLHPVAPIVGGLHPAAPTVNKPLSPRYGAGHTPTPSAPKITPLFGNQLPLSQNDLNRPATLQDLERVKREISEYMEAAVAEILAASRH